MSNEAPTDALRLVPISALPDEIDLFRILRAAGRSNREKAFAVSNHLQAIAAAPASPLPEGGVQCSGITGELKSPDLDALEKLADEATPGPWIEDKGGNLRTYGISFKNGGGYRMPIINWHGVSRPASADGAANAAFIAAANPAIIKALIAELKDARSTIEELLYAHTDKSIAMGEAFLARNGKGEG